MAVLASSPLRAPAVAVAALAATVMLAGCGEDAEPVTAAELVSRGDAICSEGRQRFAEVQSEAPPNATAAAAQTAELVRIATDELNELREIRPPDELREPYDRYLEARGRALELLEEGQEAAEDQNAKAYGRAQAEAAAAQAERLKLARAVGFKQCSRPG